ncbi:unnamed protein product, partial [marine sediment metagenome]
MQLNIKNISKGLVFNLNKNNFRLIYPGRIWKKFSSKSFLGNNLAHLLTICMPMVSGINEIDYNVSYPLFRKNFHKMVLNDIPSAVEDYKDNTKETIDRFLRIKYKFKDDKI